MLSRQEFTPQAIDELEKLAARQGNPLEKRLIETAVWYYRNKPRLAQENVMGRLEFLERMSEIMLETFALVTDRMQRVEGTRVGHPALWLPHK